MASQKAQEEAPHQSDNSSGPVLFGWRKTIEERYHKTKEDIEAYPYVWASYGLVYGGLGCWFAYRFRKLRQLEDRVRVLQERIRQRAREEEHASRNSVKAAVHTPSGPLTNSAKPTANVPTGNGPPATNSSKPAEKVLSDDPAVSKSQ